MLLLLLKQFSVAIIRSLCLQSWPAFVQFSTELLTVLRKRFSKFWLLMTVHKKNSRNCSCYALTKGQMWMRPTQIGLVFNWGPQGYCEKLKDVERDKKLQSAVIVIRSQFYSLEMQHLHTDCLVPTDKSEGQSRGRERLLVNYVQLAHRGRENKEKLLDLANYTGKTDIEKAQRPR